MLSAAGLAFSVEVADVDETAVRHGMQAKNVPAKAIAEALAMAKAVQISQRFPRHLVLGSDQILLTADGEILEKPGTRARAAAQLRQLMGQQHQLISAAVIAQDGAAIWRGTDTATLTMRPLSDRFITSYLDAEAEHVVHCVGSYRIEALGAQLFSQISGDHFTIRGLPLLAVLDYLRERGILER
jgi:septum formation protein